MNFLKLRPSEHWVLMNGNVIQSHRQLWTAWLHTMRNAERNTMTARSLDAEFMRVISGTHHVTEAFGRVGIQSDQSIAALLFLPPPTYSLEQENVSTISWPTEGAIPNLPAEFQTFFKSSVSFDIKPSIEGLLQLGIEFNVNEPYDEEFLSIAHVLLADDQSASSR